MASSSRPICSICSAVRRVSGLSIRLGMCSLACGSKFDFDRALGRVDARTDHLPVLSVDLAGAQVADLARPQPTDARVADPHATAEGERRARFLASDKDRLRPVRQCGHVGIAEANRPAISLLALLAAEVRLEVLDVKVLTISELLLPMVGHGSQHLGGSGEEGFAVAPVRAQSIEVGRGDPPALACQLLVESEP